MPAEPDERIEAQQVGVHFMLLNQPVAYLADNHNRIGGIKLVRTRLGDPDESGRRSPQPIEGSEWALEADLVVEAIGNKAPADSHQCYPHVEVSADNLIKIDTDTCKTSVPGIFAGGDIVRGPDLVVTAVRDGKTAARAIKEYLAQ
jgi:NADPH-dependent glutamate synthase beta subunit-like oxidoreductase